MYHKKNVLGHLHQHQSNVTSVCTLNRVVILGSTVYSVLKRQRDRQSIFDTSEPYQSKPKHESKSLHSVVTSDDDRFCLGAPC